MSNNTNKQIEFVGRVERQLYSSEDYKMYSVFVERDKYPDIKFTIYGTATIGGNLHSLTPGVEYLIKATEKNGNKGYLYNVINIRKTDLKTEGDVYEFLQEILTFRQASELYKYYPNIVELVMNGEADQKVDLSKLNGIKEYTFEKIKDKIVENFALYDLIGEYGGILTMGMMKKLYEKYPSIQKIKSELKNKPYKCLVNLSHVGFKTADTMLLKLEKEGKLEFSSDLKTSKDRCMACMVHLLDKNEEEGNTRMSIPELRKQVLKLCPACAHHFVDCINGNKDIYYSKETMDIALRSTYQTELYIANAILDGLKINNKYDYDWISYQNKGEFSLSDEQIELLHSVCENNITILSGGAGMGKSASTGMLIQMLKDNEKSFILMTPTGKSAKVLTNFSGIESKTVHRALNYNPKTGWGYNQDNKLECDVVLIDEFSMVSLDLMKHIIDAIDFKKTKMILIGDPNQLPSIQAGNLLHDFLQSNIIPTVKLTHVFRYGSGGILTVATDINNNKKFLNDNISKVTQIGENKDYTFIKSDDSTIIDDALSVYKKIITTGINGVVYKPEDVVILTAYNKGDYGASELNKKLQKIANKNYGSNTNFKYGENVFYIGDILMQQQNNYKIELYQEDTFGEPKEIFVANGECSVIKEIQNDGLVNELDGVDIKYYRNDLQDVSLSYAYTIHKSQGSTIKVVLVVSPKSHVYMCNANLLYVSVTRASGYVFHFGMPSTINMAMKKKENYNRNTFMQKMLKNNNKE